MPSRHSIDGRAGGRGRGRPRSRVLLLAMPGRRPGLADDAVPRGDPRWIAELCHRLSTWRPNTASSCTSWVGPGARLGRDPHRDAFHYATGGIKIGITRTRPGLVVGSWPT